MSERLIWRLIEASREVWIPAGCSMLVGSLPQDGLPLFGIHAREHEVIHLNGAFVPARDEAIRYETLAGAKAAAERYLEAWARRHDWLWKSVEEQDAMLAKNRSEEANAAMVRGWIYSAYGRPKEGGAWSVLHPAPCAFEWNPAEDFLLNYGPDGLWMPDGSSEFWVRAKRWGVVAEPKTSVLREARKRLRGLVEARVLVEVIDGGVVKPLTLMDMELKYGAHKFQKKGCYRDHDGDGNCDRHPMGCPTEGRVEGPTDEKFCNRSACRAVGATWWNTSTRAWYCAECARLINEGAVNFGDQPICFSADDVKYAEIPVGERSLERVREGMRAVMASIQSDLGVRKEGGV